MILSIDFVTSFLPSTAGKPGVYIDLIYLFYPIFKEKAIGIQNSAKETL